MSVRLRKWRVIRDEVTITLTDTPDDAGMERLDQAIRAFCLELARNETAPSHVFSEEEKRRLIHAGCSPACSWPKCTCKAMPNTVMLVLSALNLGPDNG